jgi:hypothetical protein
MVQHISSEEIRPFPKPAARKSTSNRKRAKSLILTDIPVKNQLEREMETIQAKKIIKNIKDPCKTSSSQKGSH